MDRDKPVRARMGVTLFTAIRSLLEADATRSHISLVLYSSFGIVRGRVTRTAANRYSAHDEGEPEGIGFVDPDLLELDDCEVEHYSNHLPTAHYKRLYVRTEDIEGFAFD